MCSLEAAVAEVVQGKDPVIPVSGVEVVEKKVQMKKVMVVARRVHRFGGDEMQESLLRKNASLSNWIVATYQDVCASHLLP